MTQEQRDRCAYIRWQLECTAKDMIDNLTVHRLAMDQEQQSEAQREIEAVENAAKILRELE